MKTVVFVTIVSMVFVSFLNAGCKKKAAVSVDKRTAAARVPLAASTNRLADAAYRQALDENRKEQTVKATERNKIVDQMEALIAEVKAALPPGADNAAIKAELAKKPEWRTLEAENKRMLDEIQVTLAKARETVRQRMLDDGVKKAGSEGEARPAAPAGAK